MVERDVRSPLDEEWLSAADVAEMLGCSQRTVLRWIKRGILPATFYGGAMGYRLPRSGVEAALRQLGRRGRAAGDRV